MKSLCMMSLFALALALVACGPPITTAPGEDMAGRGVIPEGRWSGTATLSISPEAPRVAPQTLNVQPAREGILVTSICPDGSGEVTVPLSSSQTNVSSPLRCAYPTEECPEGVLEFTSGAARADSDALVIQMTGNLTGCGGARPAGLKFEGQHSP